MLHFQVLYPYIICKEEHNIVGVAEVGTYMGRYDIISFILFILFIEPPLLRKVQNTQNKVG